MVSGIIGWFLLIVGFLCEREILVVAAGLFAIAAEIAVGNKEE